MTRVLVDTDIWIDHLRGAHALVLRDGDDLAYSVVTRCELFSGRDDEARLGTLLAPFQELPVDRPVAEVAGRIRRTLGTRTPDALIAATALCGAMSLMTRNRKDFEGIRGLRLRAPRG